jgi:hypothetical protein
MLLSEVPLFDTYHKCESFADASQVYNEIPERDSLVECHDFRMFEVEMW